MVFKFAQYLVFIALASICAQAQSDKRVALVIGVQSYTSVPPLKNSLNDARDLSRELKAKGFKVIELYDPKTKKDMQNSIRKYYDLIHDKPLTEGLFYYSGHAMQVDGVNYIMPATANPVLKADLDDQCLKMDFFLEVFAQAGNSLNIIIMDACRNNPFRGFTRSADQGLSQIYPPKGSYVVYATSPGSVASDGEGRNGLFTSKLLKYMNEPDLNLEQVFKLVAREVQYESGDRQLPWINSSYTGDFYFNKPTQGLSAIGTDIKRSEKNDVATRSGTPGNTNKVISPPISIRSIKISTQDWTSENLDVDTYRNGDPIPEVQDPKAWSSLTTGAWCYYENKSENGVKYGKLYNWYAVNDPRGLAPDGWHIPTEEEWIQLTTYLSADAGSKIKSNVEWFDGGSGDNSSGFSGLPAGFRYSTGPYSLMGKSGYWWTKSENNSTTSKMITVSFKGTSVTSGMLNKNSGLSVRCLRDN